MGLVEEGWFCVLEFAGDDIRYELTEKREEKIAGE